MDAIGIFTFLRLTGMPQRMQGRWSASSRAGVNGVSLKYQGVGGEPFSVRSMDFAIHYEAAKELYRRYLVATIANYPLPLVYGGRREPFQLYKVLQIVPVEVKAIVRGLKPRDTTVYRGLCVCDWLLQPIDTSIQIP